MAAIMTIVNDSEGKIKGRHHKKKVFTILANNWCLLGDLFVCCKLLNKRRNMNIMVGVAVV